MNERIQALAEQAETYADYYAMLSETGEKEIFIKKFAELIVKECMRQVEEQYLPVLEDQVMMKDTHWDGYVQCGVDSYVAIREHFFGIEE
jgi:isoaspartyl peptidase/L-asparaginase-like protein (Ntn-hydrolase superfamily)